MMQNTQLSKKPAQNLVQLLNALRALVLFCLLFAHSCAGSGSETLPDATGWFASPEDLARGIVQALSAKDRAALECFCVSRDEYQQQLWSKLPIAQIEGWKNQFQFVWSNHMAKSNTGLHQVLDKYGEPPRQLVSLRLSGQAQEYDGVKIHIKPEITIKDSSGTESKARLMGSIIEISGRYKVFSYNIEK